MAIRDQGLQLLSFESGGEWVKTRVLDRVERCSVNDVYAATVSFVCIVVVYLPNLPSPSLTLPAYIRIRYGGFLE